jgi:anthranilate synthase component 1
VTSADLGCGEARALTRRLSPGADMLSLYAELSANGTRADTLLVETLAGPSLILDQAALRIECRGPIVSAAALTRSGALVLQAIERSLAPYLESKAPDRLSFRFPAASGLDAEARLLAPSPFDAMRALVTALTSLSREEPFTLACPGIVAFDHVDLFEDLPPAESDPLGFPDFIFWLAESLIVMEPGLAPRLVCTAFGSDDPVEAERSHFSAAERLAALAARCKVASPLPNVPRSAATPAREENIDLDDREYCAVVAELKRRIRDGDIYQIVPSRTFRAPCVDPFSTFAAVRRLDPSPYMFFVAAGDHLLFGASPETAVRVSRQENWLTVEVKPIAGTRPRGETADEDDRMEADLRLDQKEIAEHMMLVDLARNDVARICIPGSRRVDRLMSVERYARVMHLVSSVRGSLAIGFDAFHALQACLNVGTLSGAPKLKAMELLRLTERTKRGPYGGAVGWVNGEGLMDTGVIIRSALVKDGIAHVRAGAGVVHDSDPQREADETRRKASAILSALAQTQFQEGETAA